MKSRNVNAIFKTSNKYICGLELTVNIQKTKYYVQKRVWHQVWVFFCLFFAIYCIFIYTLESRNKNKINSDGWTLTATKLLNSFCLYHLFVFCQKLCALVVFFALIAISISIWLIVHNHFHLNSAVKQKTTLYFFYACHSTPIIIFVCRLLNNL